MTDKKVDIVSAEGGDWQGLYVDGKLAYENHSIDWDDFVQVLDIPVGGFVVNDVWLQDNRLPVRLEDIPEEAKE